MTRAVCSALLVAAAVLGTAVFSSPATAAMSEAELRAQISATYGVRVLKIRRAEIDGRAVFLVTVMNPGGDFNEAFRVTTLAVDPITGKLVPKFRHQPSGLSGNVAPRYETGRQPTDSLSRGQIWR